MLRLVYKEAPHVFASAGPSCVSAKCSEGKMSCGHAALVREKYDDMLKNINESRKFKFVRKCVANGQTVLHNR